VLRYVPDALKDEFVNVGVVLRTSGDEGIPFSDVQFTTDWRRAKCLDPDIDVDSLIELEREIRGYLLSGETDREWLMKRMEDTFSNAIQLSPAKAVLTESPQEELGILAGMYLHRQRHGTKAVSGRQAILRTMRSEFTKQGVWDFLLQDVRIAKYTYAGDPLKIDCSYRPNGIVRMFQAVSLESDVNAAKVLAFSYPELRSGMQRLDNADPILTAIVEPDLSEEDEKIAFALHTMRKQNIPIATIADMPRIAETARLELKL
jgi:hypothetical protein